MELKRIAGLGRELFRFLARFDDCCGRKEPRQLLKAYVRGQLSQLDRKSVEPMAIEVGVAPRCLQGLLEFVKWDEEKLRDRCQEIVAKEHAHPRAIGLIDESGVPKSGNHTVGVARQWCGNTGKIDNCVVAVHCGYATEEFQCLLDSDVYLPEDWANDPIRRQQAYVPEEVQFRTKPQIAQEQIKRALDHGIFVAAWTFDELYGRDSKFLDFLELEQKQAFVGEVPANFYGWVRTPEVLHKPPPNAKKGRGRKKKYPRLGRHVPACKVQNLVLYSPVFQRQPWQPYRIKDSEKGPVVWEVKSARFYRKQSDGLPSRACTLIVARNVLNPEEIKYFVANRVPEEDAGPDDKPVTLTWLLWVAFRRWPVEQLFRQGKGELGLDHYEVRGWRCVHRHFYVTGLSYLFCARVRQEYAAGGEPWTLEQVRQATSLWLQVADLPPSLQKQRYERERDKAAYYQRRNRQARKSHTKTRAKRLSELGIEVESLPSCIPPDTS